MSKKTRRTAASCALLAALLLLLCACARQPVSLPRAQPGYLHWLEKQSMLAKAPELIAQVSQSGRLWLNSGRNRRPETLLRAAPNWVEPGAAENGKRLFGRLSALPPLLSANGFQGLYLGNILESADIWLEASASAGGGEKPASLEPDPALGGESGFEALARAAEQADVQLGSDLLPAATGRGPDFLLQARKAPGHAGLYAMLEAPGELWPSLPKSPGEWDSGPLSPESLASLAALGILPEAMTGDSFAWKPAGGWAATGEILGADGVARRWLYRYSGDPGRPVLLWQDPSGQARRLYSAAIIRQTGLQGQTLAGLRLLALMGLEPAKGASARDEAALAPGLEALNDLSEQIHRYGGWALQADALPEWAISAALKGQCDFCREDLSAALLAYGLLSGDARPLAALYEGWLAQGLDTSRLCRGFDWDAGLNPAILEGLAGAAETASALNAAFGPAPIARNRLFANPDDPSAGATWRALLSLGLPGLAFAASPEEPPLDALKPLAEARAAFGAANGRLAGVHKKGRSALALVSETEKGAWWLLALCLDPKGAEIDIPLPRAGLRARDAASGENLESLVEGRKFTLSLDGRQGRIVVFFE